MVAGLRAGWGNGRCRSHINKSIPADQLNKKNPYEIKDSVIIFLPQISRYKDMQ